MSETKFICMSRLEKKDDALFKTECYYSTASKTFDISQGDNFTDVTGWIELTMDEAKEIAKMIMEYIGEDYEQTTEN